MQTNYTLKLAVKTALAILAISAQTNVFALGLGNIEVNSQLGQALRANIKVQGASELKNVDCFRVISDGSVENQLSSANFKLSKIVDDVAILTVTTNQIISEPITNLTIAAECNANMQRDYVLLLDPPLPAAVEDSAELSTNMTEALVDSEKASTVETLVTKAPQAVKVVKKVKASKKSTAGKTKPAKKDIVLTAGYTENKPANVKSDEVKPTNLANNAVEKEKVSKPRLSISGGDLSAMASNRPQLRLDKQLQFTPDNAPAPLQTALADDIEVQDELAVMNNRMAHLKSQIDKLALANETLSNENQLKTQQLNNASSTKNSLDWLGYILGGALVFSSFSIANKWRLRRRVQLFEDTQFAQANNTLSPLDSLIDGDSFFDFDKDQAFNQAIEDTTQHFETQHFEVEVADANGLFAPTILEAPTAFSVEEFDADHNILDHADVFLSHGRTSLAIQLLQNHLIDNPKKSVTEWLFLLDLLAKDNMQAMYEQTALECKEHFNIRVAAFSNDEDSPKQHLEDFPRLVAGLEQVWGTPAAQVYLDDLIYNSRLETRVGFEKAVIEELFLLKNIAQETISTAQVIQLDDKKLELKAQKEAQLAASKEDRIKKVNELIEQKAAESRALAAKENTEATFEFSLAEFN